MTQPDTKLCFVDLETTGLDSDRHTLFEAAFDVMYPSPSLNMRRTVWVHPTSWQMAEADSTALRMNGFYQRDPSGTIAFAPDEHDQAAMLFAEVTDGAHLVGFQPHFDARFLEAFMRSNGAAPSWHYHLIDVEAMMLGVLGEHPPYKSDDLAKKLGVEIPSDRHTAMADVELAKACYWECRELQRRYAEKLPYA